MPFKFPLKPLKRHQEFKLSEAQAAFGAAISTRMRIQAELERLKASIRLQTELFEREQENGIDATRYLHFKNHLVYLERELLLTYKKLEKASMEVEKRKQAMIECDKSVKTLQSIETRDEALYRLIQSHREQKKLDDVAVFSVYRNRTGREQETHESG